MRHGFHRNGDIADGMTRSSLVWSSYGFSTGGRAVLHCRPHPRPRGNAEHTRPGEDRSAQVSRHSRIAAARSSRDSRSPSSGSSGRSIATTAPQTLVWVTACIPTRFETFEMRVICVIVRVASTISRHALVILSPSEVVALFFVAAVCSTFPSQSEPAPRVSRHIWPSSGSPLPQRLNIRGDTRRVNRRH